MTGDIQIFAAAVIKEKISRNTRVYFLHRVDIMYIVLYIYHI